MEKNMFGSSVYMLVLAGLCAAAHNELPNPITAFLTVFLLGASIHQAIDETTKK